MCEQVETEKKSIALFTTVDLEDGNISIGLYRGVQNQNASISLTDWVS